MRVYQTNEIKNIALLGSAGSGKTTLAESMLFEAGVIKRKGSVEAKNTVSDYFPVELEYGYSVFPTVFHVEWNNKKLNIIDCPGSDDFVGGAITSLNVTDQAVILINGQYGPEVGTQNNFRYTEKLGKPVIFLVNQLDSDKCDFDNIIATMKDIYGSKCVQIQYPIETGSGFNALIDVLLMKKYSWKPEGGAPIIEDIPEEEMEKAMELHTALVEAAAENDEGLMEKFFESESLTEDELREGIRKGLVTRSIFPVFCVCAGKSMGVHRLMEFLGNVVPFVSEMPKLHNTRGEEITPDSNGPESEQLDISTRYNDLITTALRTSDGINLMKMEQEFGKELADRLFQEAQSHISRGLMKIKNGRLSLTREGLYISDDVMSDFMII
jgi:elongation factor G